MNPPPSSCRHYYLSPQKRPGLPAFAVPMCRVLETFDTGDPHDRLKKLTVINEMAQSGGGVIENSGCKFAANHRQCPFYEP